MIAALGIIVTGLVGAQSGLDLSPNAGEPGTTVTVTQAVPEAERCPIGSVAFDDEPVGSGGADPGQATFTVPDVAPGDHAVSATCEGGGSAGSATFKVRPRWGSRRTRPMRVHPRPAARVRPCRPHPRPSRSARRRPPPPNRS
jgi:hypothetical protein